jgi:hypothetical protein
MKVGDLVIIKKGHTGWSPSPTGIVISMPRSTGARGFVKVHWSWDIGFTDERWGALEIIYEAR